MPGPAKDPESPDITGELEAGHRVFQAGEYDPACDLLAPVSKWLLNHGRGREGLQILEPFLAEAVRSAMTPDRAADVLGLVGNAHEHLGWVEQAIGYYAQSLVIAREIGDRRSESRALCNLGAAHMMLGGANRAISYYEQGLKIDREIGYRRSECTTLVNLGIAFAELGQAERAIGLLEPALRTGREIKDPQIEGFAAAQLERLRQNGPGGKTEDA